MRFRVKEHIIAAKLRVNRTKRGRFIDGGPEEGWRGWARPKFEIIYESTPEEKVHKWLRTSSMKFLHRNDELTRNKGNLVRMCGWWKRRRKRVSKFVYYELWRKEPSATCSAANLERACSFLSWRNSKRNIERYMEGKEKVEKWVNTVRNDLKAWEDYQILLNYFSKSFESIKDSQLTISKESHLYIFRLKRFIKKS